MAKITKKTKRGLKWRLQWCLFKITKKFGPHTYPWKFWKCVFWDILYMSYMIWYDFSELVVLRFLGMGERNYTTEQVKEYRDPPKFLALINFASNLCYHHDCKNFISSYQYQDHQKLLASLIALNPCYHQIKMLLAPKVLLEYLWPMITNPIRYQKTTL